MKITDKYVFFWNGFLSQWYPSQMTIDGIKFTSCEQYMMYKKAELFDDTEIMWDILLTDSPKEQKRLGRMVKNFNKDIWDKKCFSIVYKGNLNKFQQNNELKNQLKQTENKYLVEASPYDTIWGIGFGEDDENIEDPSRWNGLNLLGSVLMLVRNNL